MPEINEDPDDVRARQEEALANVHKPSPFPKPSSGTFHHALDDQFDKVMSGLEAAIRDKGQKDRDKALDEVASKIRDAEKSVNHLDRVADYRFGSMLKGEHYAFARGLTVNPTHLPAALDAMLADNWRLIAIFGQTNASDIGFIFERAVEIASVETPVQEHSRHQQDVIDNLLGALGGTQVRAINLEGRVTALLRANTDLVEHNRALKNHLRRMQGMMAQYLTPQIPYICESGERYIEEDAGFIHDMIYMLDGPEQRAILPNKETDKD